MLSTLRKKFVILTNPRDMVELTAPLTFIQLIFGQLPYTIIIGPETNQYECRTSTFGMCLCMGYFLFSIISLATYKHDIGEELRTGISREQNLIWLISFTTYSFCNFIVLLLRKDILRAYAKLLNQINAEFGEPHLRPFWRRINRTILAVTSIFLLYFVTTLVLAYDRILNSIRDSTNSSLSLIFLYVMPIMYQKLTLVQIVKMRLLIHWHFSYINQALSDVYRREKRK